MGKSVLVTGANSGIGLAIVGDLATAGYDVVGMVRSEEKAQAVRDAHPQVRTVVGDVGDAESTRAALEEVAKITDGGPWAVVNNAGYAQAGAVEDVDDDAARAQLEVNLVAPARIARLVLPGMRERGEGRIVMVSSIVGRMSLPVMGWYCASKHALEAVTDALRAEVAPYGVKVVLVEPGTVGTPIWAGARYPQDPATPEYAESYEKARSRSLRAQPVMPSPVWVARGVRLALANPLPQARYVVGVDAAGALVADKLVPTVVTDAVKATVAGLRRPFARLRRR